MLAQVAAVLAEADKPSDWEQVPAGTALAQRSYALLEQVTAVAEPNSLQDALRCLATDTDLLVVDLNIPTVAGKGASSRCPGPTETPYASE